MKNYKIFYYSPYIPIIGLIIVFANIIYRLTAILIEKPYNNDICVSKLGFHWLASFLVQAISIILITRYGAYY